MTRSYPLRLTAPLATFLGVAIALLIASLALRHFIPAPELAMAQAPTLGQLAGNAWSDTVGWISFDSTVVTIRSDGAVTGYAWANPRDSVALSDNIGWVSFNYTDTASCGSTPAQVNDTVMSGWAKALSADGNGWDGCISLSGVTLPSGTSASGHLSGYAWGSDVVGWVSFSGVTFTPSYVAPAAASVTLSANPARVGKGKTTTLYYTVTSPPAEGCTLSGNGMSPVTINPTSGVQGSVPSNAINANTRFTLTCGTVSGSVNVGNLPVFIEI